MIPTQSNVSTNPGRLDAGPPSGVPSSRFGAGAASNKVLVEGKEEKEFVFSSDPLQAEVERRVAKVFEVFDKAHQKIVDVREVGTMVRALDLCPTEAEVQEVIGAAEEPSTKGTIRFGTFVRYQQHNKEEMMRFFYKLDRERKGTIEPQQLKDAICREGEPFSLEEADEMVGFAMNKDDGLIHYEEYVDKTLAALRNRNF